MLYHVGYYLNLYVKHVNKMQYSIKLLFYRTISKYCLNKFILYYCDNSTSYQIQEWL